MLSSRHLKDVFVKNDDNDNLIIIVVGTSVLPEIIRTDRGLSKHENALGITQNMREKSESIVAKHEVRNSRSVLFSCSNKEKKKKVHKLIAIICIARRKLKK